MWILKQIFYELVGIWQNNRYVLTFTDVLREKNGNPENFRLDQQNIKNMCVCMSS